MALKAFFVQAFASGRTTPIIGGPKVSSTQSSMQLEYHQADRGGTTPVVEIESQQKNKTCLSRITINRPGEAPVVYDIETKI